MTLTDFATMLNSRPVPSAAQYAADQQAARAYVERCAPEHAAELAAMLGIGSAS